MAIDKFYGANRNRYERETREKINEAAFVICFDIRENLSMINASNWWLVLVPADLSHGRGKFLLRDERHFFPSTSSGVIPIAPYFLRVRTSILSKKLLKPGLACA